jgi:MoxR-like ATPase
MSEYAVSTNLISWVPAKVGIFGWPIDGAEAEVIEVMQPGDILIPKFAQNPDYRRVESQADYVMAISRRLGLDYEDEFADYEDRVAWGAGAVPFIWTVTESLGEDPRFPNGVPWRCVGIDQEQLRNPLSTSEFLKLRVIPIEIARQFKATAAPGRHIQVLSPGTADAIRRIGKQDRRGTEALRRLSLVKGDNAEEAVRALRSTGRGPLAGDYAFLVGERRMSGFYIGTERGGLERVGEEVAIPPRELPLLMRSATERASNRDRFHPGNAVAAANELADFVRSDDRARDVPEFGTFYDCYINLPKKVSQALELAARDAPSESRESISPAGEAAEDDDGEQVELDNLHGLTVTAVEAELQDIVLSDAILAEGVTALRSGKHLLLSGPPGTGKSTIAAALCRAVVDGEFDVVTATADWSTFDTIGGYMPRDGGQLEFEPGLVLRALQRGHWLVVDEINRADIDKAFGPLFTLFADSGESAVGADVVLPYRKADRSIRIVRAARREGAVSPYAVTPTWRLIGTFNARDKATLFRLSFAFLRRFAVVDVPLPDPKRYHALFAGWTSKLPHGARKPINEAAMRIAFGPRELGPAILRDIADFVNVGVAPADTASRTAPYADPVVAFLTAVRLYAVPQYEGARKSQSDLLLQALAECVPDHLEDPAWLALARAFEGIVLP